MMVMAQADVAVDLSRLSAIKINYLGRYLTELTCILPCQRYRSLIYKMRRLAKPLSKCERESLPPISNN